MSQKEGAHQEISPWRFSVRKTLVEKSVVIGAPLREAVREESRGTHPRGTLQERRGCTEGGLPNRYIMLSSLRLLTPRFLNDIIHFIALEGGLPKYLEPEPR